MNIAYERVKLTYIHHQLPSEELLRQCFLNNTLSNDYFVLVNIVTEAPAGFNSYIQAKVYFSQLLSLYEQVANIKYSPEERQWLIMHLSILSRKEGIDKEAPIILNDYKLLPRLQNPSIFIQYIQLQVKSTIATINLILRRPDAEVNQLLAELNSYPDSVREYINEV